jgi:predicted nucleic acid-binding protein
LLARCSREELTGIALFESVNNATHQFMKAEALQKGLCARQAMQYLSANPNRVKLLTDYWTNTERLLALNLLFLPVELGIVTGAQPERVAAGLLTNDSIIVAAMRGYGVSLIATSDRQFDAVHGITVFAPTDIP